MQITPICLSCARPDLDDMACAAYPKGIPFQILHGAGCDYFKQNPDPAPPPSAPLEPKTSVKDPF